MLDKIKFYIDLFQKQSVNLDITNMVMGAGFTVLYNESTIFIGYQSDYINNDTLHTVINYVCTINDESVCEPENSNTELGRMLPVLYRAIVMLYTKTNSGFLYQLKKHLPITLDELKFKLREFDCIKDGKVDWISMNSLCDYYSVEFTGFHSKLLKELKYLNEE